MLADLAPICQLVFPELPIPFALFSGLFEFAVAFGLDLFGPAFQFVFRRDVTDAAVQADRVVFFDEFADHSPSLFQRERRLGADALDF